MHVTSRRLSWIYPVVALFVLTACKKPPVTPSPQIPEVGTLTLAPQTMTVETTLSGRTAASLVAEVRARVNGIVRTRSFTEGGTVKASQSLYTIDPAPYQATLESAQASLAKAKAGLASARAQAKRYQPLVEAGAVSQQDYDNAIAARNQASAEVAVAQAAVKAAQINLDYTHVAAPISGQISRSYVTAGAYVQAEAATLMTTIQQIDPIYVDLTQSSAELLRLRHELDAGRLQVAHSGGAIVTLMLEDGSRYPHAGTLQFSETTIEPGTSTLRVRACFPNPNHELLPGLFVRAHVHHGDNPNALLVPQSSVTFDSKGEPSVLVVNSHGKVELRPITVAHPFKDQWVVTEGLQAGVKVIVRGAQQGMLHIAPGMSVKATPIPPSHSLAPSSTLPSSLH